MRCRPAYPTRWVRRAVAKPDSSALSTPSSSAARRWWRRTKATEAAKEFQKILSHRGITIGDPVFVLAHVGLARAYAISGESAKARAQYEEFFALWKHADPDCPILQRANVEYRKLR